MPTWVCPLLRYARHCRNVEQYLNGGTMKQLIPLFLIPIMLILFSGCEVDSEPDYAADLAGMYIVTEVTIAGLGTLDFTQFELFEAWFFELKEDEMVSYDNDATICENIYASEEDGITSYEEDVIVFDDGEELEYELEDDILTFLDEDGNEIVMEIYDGTVPPASWTDITLLPNDDFEPDNSFAEATTIAVGTMNEAHYFGPCDDQDYFTFTAAAGATYVIETTTDDPDIDPELDLYNSSYAWIDGDSDSGTDWNALLTWTCPSTGTYYFMIESWLNFDVGDYTVSLTQGGLGASPPSGPSVEKKKEGMEKPEMASILN